MSSLYIAWFLLLNDYTSSNINQLFSLQFFLESCDGFIGRLFYCWTHVWTKLCYLWRNALLSGKRSSIVKPPMKKCWCKFNADKLLSKRHKIKGKRDSQGFISVQSAFPTFCKNCYWRSINSLFCAKWQQQHCWLFRVF